MDEITELKQRIELLEKAVFKKRTRFTPPTLEEIEQEISLKRYNVNATQFWSHYETNGWMIGKVKMKKWKSALVTWNARNKEPKNLSYGEKSDLELDKIANSLNFGGNIGRLGQ